jgi:carbonic anhydrase
MPGDLFVVRNVANLVPPCDDNPRHHATSAALEFAVKGLNVQHIILLGHSQCGGIRALLEDRMGQGDSAAKSFIAQWMKIAEPARQKVIHQFACASLEEKARRCEETALQISLQNLYSFPWIAQSVAAGHLQLHTWHFDIGNGQLRYFDQENHRFDTLFSPFPINHNSSRKGKNIPLEGHIE